MRRLTSLFLGSMVLPLLVSPAFADDADASSLDGDPPAEATTVPRPIGISQARVAALTEELPHWALEDAEPAPVDAGDENVDLLAMDEGDEEAGDTGSAGAAGSNPLAAASTLDLIWQYQKTTNRKHVNDAYVKGSTMLHPRLKLSVELHYWETNVTGDSERDWEQLNLKPIFFVKDQPLDDVWGMRIAAGLEYIADFDNANKGIGAGADQIAPLLGFAFMNRESKTVLIPLVQHFEDIQSGADIRTTAFRLIALQPLDGGYWTKVDLKFPRDWENDEWPASAELEAGKMLTETMGVFIQGLAGIGGERPFTYGASLGLRLNF